MRTIYRYASTFLTLLCGTFYTLLAYGQSSGENYVRSAVMTEALTDVSSLAHDVARISIEYYDGLGRPYQNVRVGGSGNEFDLHTLTEYDQYGRAYRSWLPVEASSSANYLTPETIKGLAKSYYGDSHPFTESIAERTPELLDSELYGAGKNWRDNGKRTIIQRGINSGDETSPYCCPRFEVDADGRLVMNSYYADGRLRYEKTIDEDSIITISFYDTEKHKILECKTNGDSYNDTYYVYNVIGQLTYVIPPKAASELYSAEEGVCDTSIVRKQCYHYAYDQYNRLVEKRLPGAEPEYYVYDALDNIVLSQDGNLRRENKWRVQKLDHKYRKAVEGVATLVGETRASLQERWKNDLAIESVQLSYSFMNNLFYSDTCGISNFEPKVSYFYDTYEHWSELSGMNSVPADADYPTGLNNAFGLLTGKVVWDYSIWEQFVVSAITYDDKKRIVTESEIDYDGMYHLTTHHKYNFAGDLIKEKKVLVNNDLGSTITSEYYYDYDYSGSLQEVRHRHNGGTWTTLYSCSYDDLKRLSAKTIKPRNAAGQNQRLQYGYNIRNWITLINSPLFSQSFRYQDATNGAEPRWGGSPSGMNFTSVNPTGQLDTCSVNYGYDWLGRLVQVAQPTGNVVGHTFNESFSYDENGNPEIITRGNIDNNPVQYISLSYDGNHITALNESKTVEGMYPDIPSISKGDYETGWSYDANGNRTGDPSRGITSISYTIYNQPLKITFSDGSYIQHNYRSDGTVAGRTEREAVISTVNGGSNTAIRYTYRDIHRIGDFELRSTVPKRVYIDNGYIDLNENNTYTYNYYVHDHQGSVRAVIDETGALVQATDYSAYGVPSSRYAGTAENNRKHLGLEWQPMKGLYGYYNNARFRDALLAGMFYQLDPLAEKYYPFSPYSYSAGNPIKNTDKTGEFIETGWDIASLVSGVTSLYNNIKSGNYGDAIADGVGVVADAAAVMIPGVPGGAGVAIKAARTTKTIELHHLIPKKFKNEKIVQEAIKQGFKFEGKDNIIPVEKFFRSTKEGRHAKHPKYSDYIKENIKNASKKEGSALNRVKKIAEDARKIIEDNPDKKINDLYDPRVIGDSYQRPTYFKSK